MANWAYTSYAIEGPKETLERIHEAILHHDTEEGSDESWEGNVLNALNIKYVSRDQDREKGKYMRGFIQDEPWWGNDEHTLLRFNAEEAWGATDFNEVLEENLPGIKVYWDTEECGEGIYATNDKKGKYFPERFYVDTCVDGNYQSEYFTYESSMFKWLHHITNGRVNTYEKVDEFNEEHEEDDLSEDFIGIYKYTVSE